MSRTYRKNPWATTDRDNGCGGRCWCKADRKATAPARDVRRTEDYRLFLSGTGDL